MSFDAITNITKAEEDAKALIADAQVKARTMLADAESAGKKALEKAGTDAKAEKDKLFAKADSTIAASDEKSSENTDGEMAKLRESALSKVEEAAKLVAERIVKG